MGWARAESAMPPRAAGCRTSGSSGTSFWICAWGRDRCTAHGSRPGAQVGRLPSNGEGMGGAGETRDAMAGCKWRSAVRERNNIPYIIGCLRFAKTERTCEGISRFSDVKDGATRRKNFPKFFQLVRRISRSSNSHVAMDVLAGSWRSFAGGIHPPDESGWWPEGLAGEGGSAGRSAVGPAAGSGERRLNGSAGTRTGRSGRRGPAEAVSPVPAPAATATAGPAGPGPRRSRPDDSTGRDGWQPAAGRAIYRVPVPVPAARRWRPAGGDRASASWYTGGV